MEVAKVDKNNAEIIGNIVDRINNLLAFRDVPWEMKREMRDWQLSLQEVYERETGTNPWVPIVPMENANAVKK